MSISKNSQVTTHQFVAVLNKKHEIGRLLNALAHLSAGITNLNKDNLEILKFDNYIDGDGGNHPSISDNGFIIFKADNSNKIRTLRNKLTEEGIKFNDFTTTMTVGNFQEQLEATKQTKEEELEYIGICFFAEITKAKELTKKFSLFK